MELRGGLYSCCRFEKTSSLSCAATRGCILVKAAGIKGLGSDLPSVSDLRFLQLLKNAEKASGSMIPGSGLTVGTLRLEIASGRMCSSRRLGQDIAIWSSSCRVRAKLL